MFSPAASIIIMDYQKAWFKTLAETVIECCSLDTLRMASRFTLLMATPIRTNQKQSSGKCIPVTA